MHLASFLQRGLPFASPFENKRRDETGMLLPLAAALNTYLFSHD
jgi:hypothetical protein